VPQAYSPNTFLDHLLLRVLLDVSKTDMVTSDVNQQCSSQFILVIQMTLDGTLYRGIELLVSCFRVLIYRPK
jgi:hypothetical protein